MIPLNPSQLTTQNEKVVAGAQFSPKTFYLLRALFNRTGGNSGIPFTSGANLVAAGTTQASALALANDFNEITTGSGGVALAVLQPGQFQIVFNGLAGNLNVYPFLKGQINALGTNLPYVLSNGTTQIFWCPKLLTTGGTLYRTITLG